MLAEILTDNLQTVTVSAGTLAFLWGLAKLFKYVKGEKEKPDQSIACAFEHNAIGGQIRALSEAQIRLLEAQSKALEVTTKLAEESRASQEVARIRHDETVRYLASISEAVRK